MVAMQLECLPLYKLAVILIISSAWTNGQGEDDLPDYRDANLEGLLSWEPPEGFENLFPYFLSGFDDEGVPIWVAEFGKYDVKMILSFPPELTRSFKIYFLQMFARFNESPKLRSTPSNPVTEFNTIFDMTDLDVRRSLSPAGATLAFWIARHGEQFLTNHLKSMHIVNGSYGFVTLWNLLKPVLGKLSVKTDVYGTNKDIWAPKLLRNFPRDQLPPWLGGSEDHKPVRVYG